MKYPYDIAAIVHKNKTLAVEARFSKDGEDSPMKVFGDFSRYVMTAISDKKAATCNLHIEDLDEIRANTDIAKRVTYEVNSRKNAAQTGGNNSPAFTVRFAVGSLKGKSPAEVLLADPEGGKEALYKEYGWLKKNLEKYPGNKKLMDAIMDAAELDLTQLASASDTASAAPIELFNIGFRPLIRKKRESDGKCFCYEACATWDPNKNYPVSVRISNFYAPVEKREDGTLNVKIAGKDRTSEITNEVSMSSAEWMSFLGAMERARDAFYYANFMGAMKIAENEDRKARERARGEKEQMRQNAADAA